MARKRTPTETPPEPKPAPQDTETATATLSPPEPATAPLPAEPSPGFAERVGRSPRPGTAAPDPFGIASDLLAGVRLVESRRDRVMAIGFDAKPSPEVIGRMKDAGYRWNPQDQVWVQPVRPETARATRVEAERLFQEVSGLIRAEKGIESSPDIPL
ncbi:MAG: hypothetical protein K2X87_08345 [Gemmataceae bacterium]|nr:hypothetical protein [Gemmataceae bacterium]